MKEPYNKPPITIPTQIKLLEDRGLIIPDKVFAEKVLFGINYYRLSALECAPSGRQLEGRIV